MTAVVIQTQFASSDLWQNHLRRSNFASCAAKNTMALRCREELQRSKTAETVTMWAIGVVKPVDHSAWRMTESNTLRLYQSYRTAHLVTLGRYRRLNHGGQASLTFLRKIAMALLVPRTRLFLTCRIRPIFVPLGLSGCAAYLRMAP